MAERRSKGEGTVFHHAKTGKWWAQITLPDGRRKTDTKSTTKVQAQRARRRLLQEHATALSGGDVTLGEWLDYWLDEVCAPHLAVSTTRRYRSYADTWIKPTLGVVPLADIGPAHIRRLHRAMETQGRADATRRQAHAVIRRALEVAMQDERISENPCARVDAPPVGKGRHASLTIDQARTLLAAHAPGQMRARVHVALLTGARQGEALGLRWDDIDLDDATMTLARGAQTVPGEGVVIIDRLKRGEGEKRQVVLLPEVVDTLRDWRAMTSGAGYVFGPHDGQAPARADWDHKRWKEACRLACVPAVPLHGARATCATMFAHWGMPQATIATILGDTPQVAEAHYIRTADVAAQRIALAALPDRILG